ncbi:hypothetical protein KIN20_009869 [Parelaphostrongylus tenuis]|uniref:Uncharacterized protein n=1 Tax=Parelaphostrongylus tenuis TaxID=148309 RepID=A0AAD5M8S1_PARTN|nr:hypothetical protein KIN20_009869 [Parelaphostrongylus tenuis]
MSVSLFSTARHLVPTGQNVADCQQASSRWAGCLVAKRSEARSDGQAGIRSAKEAEQTVQPCQLHIQKREGLRPNDALPRNLIQTNDIEDEDLQRTNGYRQFKITGLVEDKNVEMSAE